MGPHRGEDPTVPDVPQFRVAGTADAVAIAELHADSWRRHYRGAYADGYLDGDVVADRTAVWTDRLAGTQPRHTVVAEQHGRLVGFAHTIFDQDPDWGALLDNLHVHHEFQRHGLGARLLRLSAGAVAAHGSGLHLWVLEQNRAAQAFYQALGGRCVERGEVPAPGGVPGRLNGTPACFRYVWPDPDALRRLAFSS